jgi:hypothetical protein
LTAPARPCPPEDVGTGGVPALDHASGRSNRKRLKGAGAAATSKRLREIWRWRAGSLSDELSKGEEPTGRPDPAEGLGKEDCF